jgi:uncharacterized protein YcaQ
MKLRSLAVAHSLFPETNLGSAIEQLGFVQADPIKAPAAAQDLILRQRVTQYRSGDLDRHYEALGIEEDLLYAYGFVAKRTWQCLQPRKIGKLNSFQKKILEAVRSSDSVHPRELERQFGNERVVNAWGGYSKASTEALEELQFLGLLRVARREKGIRIYASAQENSECLPAAQRARELIKIVVGLLAPISLRSLRETLSRLRFLGPTLGEIKPLLETLLEDGELRKDSIDGIDYILPANLVEIDRPRCVRFLAPFDPVVWDRRRFEHLWNWTYKFEAYTPVAKRVRGYYALPLLWGDEVIGWANANLKNRALDLDLGFVSGRPKEKQFKAELDAEISKMEHFLHLN